MAIFWLIHYCCNSCFKLGFGEALPRNVLETKWNISLSTQPVITTQFHKLDSISHASFVKHIAHMTS